MTKWNWKRYVVGPNADGKSAVLLDEATNVQHNPGIFYRATLWSAREVPVDNSIERDRANEVTTREPFPGGLLFRALEIPPDTADKAHHVEQLRKLNLEVQQKHQPSAEDLARHPSMHRTDTLDCLTCIKGEIYLVTDVDEVLMQPGDTVVIRGTNHAWSNRSNEPCLLCGCMIDATQRSRSANTAIHTHEARVGPDAGAGSRQRYRHRTRRTASRRETRSRSIRSRPIRRRHSCNHVNMPGALRSQGPP